QRALIASQSARYLLESGAPRAELEAARTRLEGEIDATIAGWRALPAEIDGVGFLHWGTQRMPISEAIRLDLALDGQERGAERGFELLMKAQRAGTLARRLGDPAVTIAEVRATLVEPGLGL